MEIFIKQEVIREVWVRLYFFIGAEYRSIALFIFFENIYHALRKIIGDFFQCAHSPGTGRMFHFEIASVIVVKSLQGFNDEVIYRKPDRPAPVGISPKHTRVTLTRSVFYLKLIAIFIKRIRILEVLSRQRANTKGRKKFTFIKHSFQQSFHPVAAKERSPITFVPSFF